MNKNKPKVSFYGKDMGLLEAKLFSLGLRIGIVDITLTEEDLGDYSRWKSIRKNRNALSRKLVKEETYKKLKERDYLFEMLNNQIKSVKSNIIDFKYKEKNIKYCEKHGHTEKEGSAYCERCGVIYGKESSLETDKDCGETGNPFRG